MPGDGLVGERGRVELEVLGGLLAVLRRLSVTELGHYAQCSFYAVEAEPRAACGEVCVQVRCACTCLNVGLRSWQRWSERGAEKASWRGTKFE